MRHLLFHTPLDVAVGAAQGRKDQRGAAVHDVAAVQLGARQNGRLLDSTAADLSVRDAQLAAHAEFRKQLYAYDVVPECVRSSSGPLGILTSRQTR